MQSVKRLLSRSFFPVFALFFLLSDATPALARHIIGGEITYVCLGATPNQPGSNRYRFTMKIYRDCRPSAGGAPFDNNPPISIYRGTMDNSTFVTKFYLQAPLIKKLNPDTPRCVSNIPTDICVEEGTYTFTRDLPIITQSYVLVYQRCCRNNTINNLIDPGDIGATFAVELTPEAQQLCNNSPVFNNFPPIIICNNFPLEFDHSATDPEGDQLVYSFCSPWAGGGNITMGGGISSCFGAVPDPPCPPPFDNVPFITPTYTPGAPLGGNPVVTINSTTGFISGTPVKQGQFVVGVCVQEFRNGVLLSTLKREFQFNVAGCEPQVAANIERDSITGPQQFYLKSCGINDYKFLNLSQQKANVDKFIWEFNLNNGSTFKDSLNWDVTVPFPDTGFYRGRLLLNPGEVCSDTAFITIDIHPDIHADFEYLYDTCVAGPVQFTDLSFGEGVLDKWRWNFGVVNGLSNTRNPAFQYNQPGDHPVRLTVTDRNGCQDDTTKVISWFPAPPVIIVRPDSYLGCAPADIFFNNLSSPIDSTYDIKWNFGDGTTEEGVISPSHLYTETGSYTVDVEITSPIGCKIAASFPNLIRVEPKPTADFTCDPDTMLSTFNNTVRFIDQSIGAVKWNWQLGKVGNISQRNPIYTFPDTGQVRVRLLVTHPEGCQDSLVKFLDIVPFNSWTMPNAFTPNGDGTNEAFFGKGYLVGASNFNMSIWNRWGEKVFETQDPEEGWNGRQMNTGGMSPAGVYVYIVTFTGPRGQKQEYKGYATLIR